MRVAIIGNFDGVHRGHRALLHRARERAGGSGGRVVAVTFDPHPAAVLRPDRAPQALTTLARRTELLLAEGADEVVVLAFTPELSAKTPEEFARLIREDSRIAADVVIVGDNFRFGARASGDTAALAEFGARLGFEVEALPLVAAEGSDAASSSRIRQSVAEGDLPGARALLGRPHRLEGIVVRGDQRGRELGYPTANVDVADDIAIPPDGVYAGWLIVDDTGLAAAISIGSNPQFSGSERRVEAYAIDRHDLDLYGSAVAVDLVVRLRGQEVFDSVDALVEQMGRDVAAARSALGD